MEFLKQLTAKLIKEERSLTIEDINQAKIQGYLDIMRNGYKKQLKKTHKLLCKYFGNNIKYELSVAIVNRFFLGAYNIIYETVNDNSLQILTIDDEYCLYINSDSKFYDFLKLCEITSQSPLF